MVQPKPWLALFLVGKIPRFPDNLGFQPRAFPASEFLLFGKLTTDIEM